MRNCAGYDALSTALPHLAEPYTGKAITQQRRLDLLRRFATSTDIPIEPRAAACLMLLYAQPLSRIRRLTTADLARDDDQTWLHLGDPPSPAPSRPRSTRCCISSPPPAIACPGGRTHRGGGVSSMLCGTAVSNTMSRGQLSTISR